MRSWFRDVSARLAAYVIFATATAGFGLSAALWATWHYLVSAAWPVWIPVVLCGAVICTALAWALVQFMRTPPANGIYSARSLRWYRYPIRKVSWNFDNFLGARSGAGSPILVTSFQPSFCINWGEGIRPKAAYMISNRTGNRADVLIECGNPYVGADTIEFMPRGKRYHCRAFFEDEGLTKEKFLQQFDGFDFVFEYDSAVFRRKFSRQEIEDYFGSIQINRLNRNREQSRESSQPSPISFSISAVCWPSLGAGLGEAAGLPSNMIGVRTPGMVPAFASGRGSAIFMPRCLTCGSSNT